MSDTTNIMDLPTDPLGGGNISNNISLSAKEHLVNSEPNMPTPGVSLDQTTINQIVNGLQQATVTGATLLPSRNIPQATSPLTQDPVTQPNYIPPIPVSTKDYIQESEYETNEEILKKYNRSLQRENSLDDLYNEIQNPLLLAVLYFLFQLPFFRKFLLCYIPGLFHKDGNYNLSGYVFCSILYGLMYYVLEKLISLRSI